MDTETVKGILQIKTEKHDSYIGIVLPMFIQAVKTKCNNKFLNSDGVESIPEDVKIAIAKWIQLNMHIAGVQGRSQGVSYSYSTEIPETILALIRPYKKLRVGGY